MKKALKIIAKGIAFIVLCGLLLIVWFFDTYKLSAFAATDDSVQTAYEQTNVLDNLKGSTIGGKEFDLKDYPHNSNGKPQIISFVEFCYSYYAEKQDDFGLYVYIYNPQDIALDMATERNKIQLTYGDNPSYSKYVLEFLNYSTEAGYEGRFYKFRVQLTEAQKSDILRAVKSDERIYKISGIELSVKNNVTEYTCATTYTYKGYAFGYGSELAQSDTLSCKVDGFDKFLSLDVHSTYWRPKGTHSDGYTKDTIHSVYFSVPNDIITEYGEMTGVHATWLNAYTAPILVTGNQTIYSTLQNHINKYVGGDSKEDYSNRKLDYTIVATKAAEGLRDDVDMAPYGGYYAYNPYYSCYNGDNAYINSYDHLISYLRYLFYADNGNADTYVLPAEKLIGDKVKGVKGWFETYTEKYGGTLINNRYSKALFDKVDTKFTDAHITSNDEYKLTDNTVSDKVWDRLFGNSVKHENSYTFSAIQKVTVSDINHLSDKTAFCNSYYVAESDYNDFTKYVRDANAKKETVYLFRYTQTEYVANEATEYSRDKEWYLFGGNFGKYKYVDTNAYFCQMWVQLDFDIIDLTFTKDDVVTVIPVIMSPIDIAADGDHPASTQPEKGLAWWQILLGIIALVIILWLLIKFAPPIIYALGAVISIPFKAIGGLIKSGKERQRERKAERENRKQEKRGKKARKRMDDWFKNEDKKQEKLKRKAKKVNVEKLKRDIWGEKRSELDLSDAEKYALHHDEEWQTVQEELGMILYGYADEYYDDL